MPFAPKHILVPVAIEPGEDFALAEDAVFTACDIAEEFFSKITLLHLATVMMAGGSAGMDVSGKIYESYIKVLENRLSRDKRKLKELQEVGKTRGVAIEGRVVDSLESTAMVILETASDLNVDLLVIGSHGRHGLSKVLFGSVAQSVAIKATIPVLLLHPKKA